MKSEEHHTQRCLAPKQVLSPEILRSPTHAHTCAVRECRRREEQAAGRLQMAVLTGVVEQRASAQAQALSERISSGARVVCLLRMHRR